MTRTSHDRSKHARSENMAWTSYSIEEKFEKLDREADHEYVPMDLFIDSRTMQEHFQQSSVQARLTGIH